MRTATLSTTTWHACLRAHFLVLLVSMSDDPPETHQWRTISFFTTQFHAETHRGFVFDTKVNVRRPRSVTLQSDDSDDHDRQQQPRTNEPYRTTNCQMRSSRKPTNILRGDWTHLTQDAGQREVVFQKEDFFFSDLEQFIRQSNKVSGFHP